MKKKNLSYIDSVHRDGRIWNITVMVLLMAFPLTVAAIFSVMPDWKALGLGLVATATGNRSSRIITLIFQIRPSRWTESM